MTIKIISSYLIIIINGFYVQSTFISLNSYENYTYENLDEESKDSFNSIFDGKKEYIVNNETITTVQTDWKQKFRLFYDRFKIFLKNLWDFLQKACINNKNKIFIIGIILLIIYIYIGPSLMDLSILYSY